MRDLNFTGHMVLLAVSFLSGCGTTGLNAVAPETAQPNLSGDWRVYYDIPETMAYTLNLSVTIAGGALPDQSGAWLDPKDLNSRVSEGWVNGAEVTFRWIYQTVGVDGETGPVLWDHDFEGQHRLDENGEDILFGTLTGVELNGICAFPIPGVTPEVQKLPNGECPPHKVSGTWHAKRDVPNE